MAKSSNRPPLVGWTFVNPFGLYVVVVEVTANILARPRLIERLSDRWQARATTIVAATGFGKSVLLHQAIAENQLSPRGRDVLV